MAEAVSLAPDDPGLGDAVAAGIIDEAGLSALVIIADQAPGTIGTLVVVESSFLARCRKAGADTSVKGVVAVGNGDATAIGLLDQIAVGVVLAAGDPRSRSWRSRLS